MLFVYDEFDEWSSAVEFRRILQIHGPQPDISQSVHCCSEYYILQVEVIRCVVWWSTCVVVSVVTCVYNLLPFFRTLSLYL